MPLAGVPKDLHCSYCYEIILILNLKGTNISSVKSNESINDESKSKILVQKIKISNFPELIYNMKGLLFYLYF